MIGDSINDLSVHDHGITDNEIRDIFTNRDTSIQDRITALLSKRDRLVTELNHKRILVGLFMQAMSDLPDDSECTSHDPKNKILLQDRIGFVFIRG